MHGVGDAEWVCSEQPPNLARTTGTCRKPRQLAMRAGPAACTGAHLGRARLHESVTAREKAALSSMLDCAWSQRWWDCGRAAEALTRDAGICCKTVSVIRSCFRCSQAAILYSARSSPGCVYDGTTNRGRPAACNATSTATSPSSAAAGWAPDTGRRAQRHSVRHSRLHSASTQRLSQNLMRRCRGQCRRRAAHRCWRAGAPRQSRLQMRHRDRLLHAVNWSAAGCSPSGQPLTVLLEGRRPTPEPTCIATSRHNT